MRRGLIAVLLALPAASPARPSPAALAPTTIGCAPWAQRIPQAQPITAGPLSLRAIRCFAISPDGWRSPLALSPDGRNAFTNDGKNGLFVGAMAGGPMARAPLTLAPDGIGGIENWSAAWRSDSRGIWVVTQRIMAPRGGWALEPKRPLIVSLDARQLALPALVSAAGGLDGISWIGGDGLALATFGARGGMYKPERPNPTPTLALIDARRGRIIQSARMTATTGLPFNLVSDAAGVIDRRGRIRLVMWFGGDRWTEWMQGSAPRSIHVQGTPLRGKFALAADGAQLLLAPGLSATGAICEFNPKCPPPVPTTGVAIELRDIATGRRMWSISATARNFASTMRPVVSRGGRYALVALPSDDGVRDTIALITMRDGRIVQRLNQTAGMITAGFGAGDRSVWIGDRNTITVYTLR